MDVPDIKNGDLFICITYAKILRKYTPKWSQSLSNQIMIGLCLPLCNLLNFTIPFCNTHVYFYYLLFSGQHVFLL